MSCTYCFILDCVFVVSTLRRLQLKSVNIKDIEDLPERDKRSLDTKYNKPKRREVVLMMYEMGLERNETKTNGIHNRLQSTSVVRK